MKNPRLFVRSRQFDGDGFTCYWSSTNHAWGSLTTATVFTMDEVERYNETKRLDVGRWCPPEGEWDELPDRLKFKTNDEWFNDLEI